MVYFWKLPPEPDDIPAPQFPRVFAGVASGLFAALALLIGAISLDASTLTIGVMAWRLLAFPVFVGMIVFTITVIIFLITYAWNFIARRAYLLYRQGWQQYASVCIRLAEHHSLFPVENAALKMIGLEGEMPAEKDIPRKLNISEDEEKGLSRPQQTLKTLLEKMDISMMDERCDQPQVWLYIRNANGSTNEDAEAIFRQHHPIFNQSNIHILSALPERALLEKWTLESFAGFRLLIVIELHGDNDDNFCEYATALLFSRQRRLPDTRMPVWCFSSLDCQPHRVGKHLKVLLAAEQIKSADLRHVWTGNLKGESLNLLSDAFTEVETGVKSHQRHSMWLAETWTQGYQWLMLEWSARAIRNGQRGQLLAIEHAQNKQINLALISGETLPHQVETLNEGCCVTAHYYLLLALLFLLGFEGILLLATLRQGWSLNISISGWSFIYGPLFSALFVLLISNIGLRVFRSHCDLIEDYYYKEE